jgi:hypothetical protein
VDKLAGGGDITARCFAVAVAPEDKDPILRSWGRLYSPDLATNSARRLQWLLLSSERTSGRKIQLPPRSKSVGCQDVELPRIVSALTDFGTKLSSSRDIISSKVWPSYENKAVASICPEPT